MILALDNALGTTGYAVFKKDKTLVYCDKFKTKSKGLDDKLNEITDYLLYLVERFEITHIVIEDTQSQSNKDTFKMQNSRINPFKIDSFLNVSLFDCD